RFTSSHPKDLSEATLRVMAEEPTICEHLHLALQSGSDSVLTAMGRKYTAGHFRKLIETARRLIPGLAVTTDIIVGYPGEGEANFAQTLSLVEELGFDNAFMFKYSPRAGTASAQLEDDVPPEVKQERLEQIIAAVTASARNNNAGLVGRRLKLIVEGRDKKSRCFGRTRSNKNVKLDSDHEAGTLLTVEITSAGAFSLAGTVIDEGTIDG
ncbi:radical SAM protein, partial [bacterium]|nr:radical SAM protein [bacterium]